MEIMTISSLAGLGRLGTTIPRTNGAAYTYLTTVMQAQLANDALNLTTAARSGKIPEEIASSMGATAQALTAAANRLIDLIPNTPADTLSDSNAALLSSLDGQVAAFHASVAQALGSSNWKMWALAGVGFVTAAAGVIWLTRRLPSYRRTRRRRRRR